MMALASRSGPSRWPQRNTNIKEVRSRRAYHDTLCQTEATTTQGTRDCGGDPPTRTAVRAAVRQAPQSSLDDREWPPHNATEQRGEPAQSKRERERERKTVTAQQARHKIFHTRIAPLVDQIAILLLTRVESPEQKTRQVGQKTPITTTLRTWIENKEPRPLSQTDHAWDPCRAAIA